MPEPIFLFVVFALFTAAFIKGSLGLGFSTIGLAILANVIELKTAISIVLLPSLLSNIIVMIDAGNFRYSLSRFAWMLAAAIPGMALGLQLLKQPENSLSVILLGLVLIIYGGFGLFGALSYSKRPLHINDNLVPRLNPIIGLFTGMVNGATGSQIFPIMPYLLAVNINKEVLVQTLNLSFTLCSLIMLGSLYAMNTLDTQSIAAYSLGIIPVAFGVWLGNKVRKRLSEKRFRQSVMILIVVLGVLLISRSA